MTRYNKDLIVNLAFKIYPYTQQATARNELIKSAIASINSGDVDGLYMLLFKFATVCDKDLLLQPLGGVQDLQQPVDSILRYSIDTSFKAYL